MKCPGCERELLKREHAQPIVIQDIRFWPASYCDACCRKNLWPAGSHQALERLATGKRDDQELALIGERTADWGLPDPAHLAWLDTLDEHQGDPE